MWTISAIALVLVGAGSAASGQVWGLWLLIAGGLCGARAERRMRDQELAIALFLWVMIALVLATAALVAWRWLLALFG